MLHNLTTLQESVIKSKNSSLLNRVFGQVTTSTSSTTTSGTTAAAFMKFSGFGGSTEKEKEKPGEDLPREEDGRIALDTAEKILKWHAEAIGRCVELSFPYDVYVDRK